MEGGQKFQKRTIGRGGHYSAHRSISDFTPNNNKIILCGNYSRHRNVSRSTQKRTEICEPETRKFQESAPMKQNKQEVNHFFNNLKDTHSRELVPQIALIEKRGIQILVRLQNFNCEIFTGFELFEGMIFLSNLLYCITNSKSYMTSILKIKKVFFPWTQTLNEDVL